MSGSRRHLIPTLATALALVGAGSLPAVAAPQSWGVESDSDAIMSRRVAMGVGKSIIVDLPADAAEIVVGNPKVANAVVRSTRKLYIMGVETGQTTIFALDRSGRQIANLEISIGRDVGELGPLLHAALPNSNISARTVNDAIILTGTVDSASEAQRAVDIAKGFAARSASASAQSAGGSPADGLVVNALVIRTQDQVMLKVTVAEVERRVLKQLGISAQSGGETLLKGGWGQLVQQNPFAVNSALTASSLTINGNNGSTATLQAYERYGVSRVLAEPTVTAISGESAKFTVGGEIAVPGNSSCIAGSTLCSSVGIVFKPYGVSLNFTPVVLAQGRILLHLATEVTEIDYQAAQAYNGVTVPGFKTRKNETSVELPSGGSIATAGLLTQKSDQAINGLPGLINLPVLGALFRSRDYQRNETELLIVVTPYIARALSARDVTRPDDGFADASDPQAWLLGRVNRLYANPQHPQAAPQLKGRIGFIQD
ncbi:MULTISPECIES: type II and III secretion system protein family protein [Methylosinus]|uniref:Secretin n=1 Tax=Methylosinus trichosporium (strain ATCC 35070 / NCIMB 11131 / UNIQEM 75 / OB3b) TaxID=595536 RepID=A0A2D2D649_METT3|nr:MULTISPECIES: type II and III secretion system protein family protein [Methylosinus]ATQ70453.1 secretin [Methylosinus trichosporium OB3b]OBS53006.1 secretin [Methylosinus sp. 3S-1]